MVKPMDKREYCSIRYAAATNGGERLDIFSRNEEGGIIGEQNESFSADFELTWHVIRPKPSELRRGFKRLTQLLDELQADGWEIMRTEQQTGSEFDVSWEGVEYFLHRKRKSQT
jgi:hypothetical protein